MRFQKKNVKCQNTKIRWSLEQEENGAIHLIVKGKEAVTCNGQEKLVVVCLVTGYNSKEIWAFTINANRITMPLGKKQKEPTEKEVEEALHEPLAENQFLVQISSRHI